MMKRIRLLLNNKRQVHYCYNANLELGHNIHLGSLNYLERNQVIGPQKGSKPRQVLIDLNKTTRCRQKCQTCI